MPEMRLRPGLRPGPHWGAHKPIAGFDGPLCGGGRKEEGTKGKGKGKNRKGEEGKGRKKEKGNGGEGRKGDSRGGEGPRALKTPFCAPTDELLLAKDDLLSEGGQSLSSFTEQ